MVTDEALVNYIGKRIANGGEVMEAMVAGIVLFTVLAVFAVMIGVISSRDEHAREENAGNTQP